MLLQSQSMPLCVIIAQETATVWLMLPSMICDAFHCDVDIRNGGDRNFIHLYLYMYSTAGMHKIYACICIICMRMYNT